MSELKRGTKVRIPKGTYIWGTFAGHEKLAGRTYTVSVFDSSPGYPADERYGIKGLPEHVTWPGAGGYWHNAALADVEVL